MRSLNYLVYAHRNNFEKYVSLYNKDPHIVFYFFIRSMLSSRTLMLLFSRYYKIIPLAFVICMIRHRTIDAISIKPGLNKTCRNSLQYYLQGMKDAF